MSVETEVRELKDEVGQLKESQATIQSMLNEVLLMLSSDSNAGSPGPPDLNEEN